MCYVLNAVGPVKDLDAALRRPLAKVQPSQAHLSPLVVVVALVKHLLHSRNLHDRILGELIAGPVRIRVSVRVTG